MDTNEPEAIEPDVEQEEELAEPEATETPDWEARAKRLEEKAIQQRERTRLLKAEMEKLKKAHTPKEVPQTGELNETQLDYLELKGVSEQEDIDYIQKVVSREGITVRQALKDDMVKEKLAKHAQRREVKAATPSTTRRGGQESLQGVDYWAARIESGQSQLSDIPDFETRAAVVEAREKRSSNNVPPWRH